HGEVRGVLARERHRLERDDVVRAEAVHARPPGAVGHEVHARAVREAAALVVAGQTLDLDLRVRLVEVDPRDPAQLLREDVALPAPLRGERHVRELPPSHPAGTGLRPHRRHPVGRRLEDLDRVGAPELRGVAALRDARADALAGQRVAHEDDAAVVPRDAVPAVRDRADLELDLDLRSRLDARRPPGLAPRAPARTARDVPGLERVGGHGGTTRGGRHAPSIPDAAVARRPSVAGEALAEPLALEARLALR